MISTSVHKLPVATAPGIEQGWCQSGNDGTGGHVAQSTIPQRSATGPRLQRVVCLSIPRKSQSLAVPRALRAGTALAPSLGQLCPGGNCPLVPWQTRARGQNAAVSNRDDCMRSGQKHSGHLLRTPSLVWRQNPDSDQPVVSGVSRCAAGSFGPTPGTFLQVGLLATVSML